MLAILKLDSLANFQLVNIATWHIVELWILHLCTIIYFFCLFFKLTSYYLYICQLSQYLLWQLLKFPGFLLAIHKVIKLVIWEHRPTKTNIGLSKVWLSGLLLNYYLNSRYYWHVAQGDASQDNPNHKQTKTKQHKPTSIFKNIFILLYCSSRVWLLGLFLIVCL